MTRPHGGGGGTWRGWEEDGVDGRYQDGYRCLVVRGGQRDEANTVGRVWDRVSVRKPLPWRMGTSALAREERRAVSVLVLVVGVSGYQATLRYQVSGPVSG